MKRLRLPPVPRLAGELGLLLLIAIAALAIRAWVVGLYLIPTGSMLPRLMAGDYVLVAKFPFRLQHRLPARGEALVFHAPPPASSDYVKRVVGLPGDTIALQGGRLVLNGRTLPRWRIADLVVPVTPNSPCVAVPESQARRERAGGGWACRMPRYREMLPGGTMIDLLDMGRTAGDDYGPVRVAPGHLFLLGDNRDDSRDSRFRAVPGGGIGLVPLADVVGRADVTLFSVDGSAILKQPGTWLRAIRWERIGTRH